MTCKACGKSGLSAGFCEKAYCPWTPSQDLSQSSQKSPPTFSSKGNKGDLSQEDLALIGHVGGFLLYLGSKAISFTVKGGFELVKDTYKLVRAPLNYFQPDSKYNGLKAGVITTGIFSGLIYGGNYYLEKQEELRIKYPAISLVVNQNSNLFTGESSHTDTAKSRALGSCYQNATNICIEIARIHAGTEACIAFAKSVSDAKDYSVSVFTKDSGNNLALDKFFCDLAAVHTGKNSCRGPIEYYCNSSDMISIVSGLSAHSAKPTAIPAQP